MGASARSHGRPAGSLFQKFLHVVIHVMLLGFQGDAPGLEKKIVDFQGSAPRQTEMKIASVPADSPGLTEVNITDVAVDGPGPLVTGPMVKKSRWGPPLETKPSFTVPFFDGPCSSGGLSKPGLYAGGLSRGDHGGHQGL